MYGFPNINELKPLIGQTLVQISCTANQVIFEFDGKTRITCEKNFRLSEKAGKIIDIGIPLDNLYLLQLLDNKIEAVVGENKDCIVLRFSNGDKISLIDDCYESFKLTIGNKEYLV